MKSLLFAFIIGLSLICSPVYSCKKNDDTAANNINIKKEPIVLACGCDSCSDSTC